MKNSLSLQTALVASAMVGLASAASAQQTTPPASPPAAAPAAPQAISPAPTQTPAEPAPTAPSPSAPSATAPAASPATAAPQAQPAPPAAASQSPAAVPAPGTDATLPPVQVIQQQPKPQPPAPPPQIVKKQKPKPPVQQAAPPPPPPQPVAQTQPAAPQPLATNQAPPLTTAQQRAQGDVVRVAPIGGTEIAVEKVPGAVSTVSADTLASAGSKEPQDVLQKEVPGVIVGDVAGNDLRTQIEYRGFEAGGVNGFPQGLAIYQNGIRINEVFGDTVNWDLIPKNAISDMTVLSGNPIFGLNAIGGSVSLVMKDGFNYQGAEVDLMVGSFGRRQIGAQAGGRSGAVAAYFAGELIEEDGWRDFSPAEVKRAYFDLGMKGSRVEAHINLTMADSFAGVVTASPVELLAAGRELTYTSPQTTDLTMLMPSFNVAVKATDTLTISGLGYYRKLKSRVIDGNNLDGEECGDVLAENPGAVLAPGVTVDHVCSGELEGNEIVALENAAGQMILADDLDEPFGVIDRINTDAKSFGFTVQAVEKRDLFGHKNQFVIGASYDQGKVRYTTSSELGSIGNNFFITGSGFIISEPDDFAARDVAVDTRYLGLYLLDTLDLTDRLTLTFGGRFNYAKIDLEDKSGDFPDITSKHDFSRFNPTVGATYEVVPGITFYGGYSEANRAPTPAELACANPDNPCPIESFLTDDPPLKQVVSKTYEAGIRGRMKSHDGLQRLDWGLGLFQTTNEDDILFVSSTTTGRGFFFNAGETLRRGLEASLKYKYGPLSAYASYSYIEATYETANEFSSPAHPDAGVCAATGDIACINVRPGDNIPGIPNHRFKTGFDYWMTPRWKVGADLIAASGQYYFGDNANLLEKLGGYTRVDVSTSFDVTENIQLYAFAKNIFDARYGLFGTLFEADEAPVVGPHNIEFENPRSVVPAAPVAIYGGVKIKY